LSFGNKEQEMLVDEVPRKSQRNRKSGFPDDYKVYDDIKEFKIEGDPTLFEKS